jgi:hypothetical protein
MNDYSIESKSLAKGNNWEDGGLMECGQTVGPQGHVKRVVQEVNPAELAKASSDASPVSCGHQDMPIPQPTERRPELMISVEMGHRHLLFNLNPQFLGGPTNRTGIQVGAQPNLGDGIALTAQVYQG